MSAASSTLTRDQAGVEHGVLRFNPELHGILFQAKVPWDYLSEPQVIAYLFYVNFSVVCPSSWPQAR
jgi:hypothetical protein